MLFLTPTYLNAVLPGLSTIQQIEILQKRVLELIVPNQGISKHSPLFKHNFILEFQHKICFENILFVSKSLNNLLTSFPQINIMINPQVLLKLI